MMMIRCRGETYYVERKFLEELSDTDSSNIYYIAYCFEKLFERIFSARKAFSIMFIQVPTYLLSRLETLQCGCFANSAFNNSCSRAIKKVYQRLSQESPDLLVYAKCIQITHRVFVLKCSPINTIKPIKPAWNKKVHFDDLCSPALWCGLYLSSTLPWSTHRQISVSPVATLLSLQLKCILVVVRFISYLIHPAKGDSEHHISHHISNCVNHVASVFCGFKYVLRQSASNVRLVCQPGSICLHSCSVIILYNAYTNLLFKTPGRSAKFSFARALVSFSKEISPT